MLVNPGYQSLYRETRYHNFGIAGYLYLQWWTHKIGGLHKNDFIMAAKSDEIFGPSRMKTSRRFTRRGFLKLETAAV